jgi:hypothetical protein
MRHLDKALQLSELSIIEFEDAIELWITYGGS